VRFLIDECLSVDLVTVAGQSGHEAQHGADDRDAFFMQVVELVAKTWLTKDDRQAVEQLLSEQHY
jgi:hypothetical protein